MKLNRKYNMVLVVAGILLIGGVITLAQVHAAHERTKAKTAAAAYVSAAHAYMQKAAPLLNTAGSPNTTNDQSDAAIKSIEKMAVPQLAAVKGSASHQAAYVHATAFAKQVAAFVNQVKSLDAKSDQYQATYTAYVGLYDLEETGIPQMNGSSDPTGLLTGFVTTLSAQRQALQQARITEPALKSLATSTEKAETDYINAFTSLVGMLKSGNPQSINYNYYGEVTDVYNAGEAYAGTLNKEALALQVQAQKLATQS